MFKTGLLQYAGALLITIKQKSKLESNIAHNSRYICHALGDILQIILVHGTLPLVIDTCDILTSPALCVYYRHVHVQGRGVSSGPALGRRL